MGVFIDKFNFEFKANNSEICEQMMKQLFETPWTNKTRVLQTLLDRNDKVRNDPAYFYQIKQIMIDSPLILDVNPDKKNLLVVM